MNDLQMPELVQSWLERARSDLNLGRAALGVRGVLPEDSCFHAQQCAEKALKGMLTARSVAFPRTHVIETLLDLLKAKGLVIPENVDEASEIPASLALFFHEDASWRMMGNRKYTGRWNLKPALLVFPWTAEPLKR